MFFRVVNARYKEKEYTYLKLLESHRYGDKIKHKQLVNLSNINHLPADRIKPLLEDLSKTLTVFRELSGSVSSSCKYLKTSYILALEKAFNIPQSSQDHDLKETILSDLRKRHCCHNDQPMFDYISKTYPEYGFSPETYCWVECSGNNPQKNHLVCYLMDIRGFPLKYAFIDGPSDKTITSIHGLIFQEKTPAFFLARSCERIYSLFQLPGAVAKEKGYVFKEIYLVEQMADCPDKTELLMEKVSLCGPVLMMKEERISAALLAAIGLKDHVTHVIGRINSVRGTFPLSDRDLVCTCFLSLFFRKIFETIKVRHNI